MISLSARTVSPPTTPARVRPTSAASPSNSSVTVVTGVCPGHARPTTTEVGVAPMAATSARFTAAAFRPTWAGVDQSRRKCTPSTSVSVVSTTRPSGAATTAASSPGPSTVPDGWGRPVVIAWIRPNSPAPATVSAPGVESCSTHTSASLVDARHRIRASEILATLRYLACRVPGRRRVSTGFPVRRSPPAADTKGRSAVVHAYILIQTEVGRAAAVAAEIADIPGVASSEDVTGPYDVIVRAEAEDVDQLGRLVVARVQNVEGITRTLTCPVVHL